LIYIVGAVVAAVLLFILFHVLWKLLKGLVSKMVMLLVNSLLGLAALMGLNYLGLEIPIILPTLIIVALFGLPGILSLVILFYFGLI